MSTNIRERAAGPGARLIGLLATIRWEAQFKLAKCCMHASKSISDLGVFLAEPVLERSKALNDVTARLRENAPQLIKSRFSHFAQSSPSTGRRTAKVKRVVKSRAKP